MKRASGIARCGLACRLCSENVNCGGCDSGECPDRDWRENRRCSKERGISHCYACEETCKKGIVYHREGINGDYDDFDDVEKLVEFIKTGKHGISAASTFESLSQIPQKRSLSRWSFFPVACCNLGKMW